MGVMNDFLTGQDSSKRASDNEKYMASLQQRVVKINALEATIEDLGDDELELKTNEFRERLAKGEDLNGSLLEEAFAVVREAAWYVNRKSMK
jgi:preprotein translocase subunit SecA